MLAQNPTRIDLYERYQQIVAQFNRDKDEVEIQRVFDELIRIDRLLEGMPAEFSQDALLARADRVFDYVQSRVHSAALH